MYNSSLSLFAFVDLRNQCYVLKFVESTAVEEWPSLADNHASGRLKRKQL